MFNITSSTAVLDVTISGLTITGGKTTGTNHGAGIYNTETLTLDHVGFVDNHALNSGRGGGLYSSGGNVEITASTFDENSAHSGGGARIQLGTSFTATIVDSTFSNNLTTTNSGGGLLVEGSASSSNDTVLITNSTFSGNEAELYGGGIRFNDGVNATIVNTTIVKNTANDHDGGVSSVGGSSVLVHNSILAENVSVMVANQADAAGGFNSTSSYNLVGTTNVSALNDTATDHNIVIGSSSAGLAPLGSYGGPTQTHALLDVSDAIEAANSNLALTTYGLAFDQRGKSRQVGAQVDIGAYETGNDYSLLVTTSSDESNSGYEADDLSLREALELTDSLAGTATIQFADNVTEIIVGSALVIDKDMTIAGPGADLLTISGGDVSRVFEIDSGATVSLNSITISDGNVASGNGEAIYSTGALTLIDVVVADNYGSGSAIHQVGGSLSLLRTAVENNAGSAMRIEYADSLAIDSSTIAENSSGTGAAIFVIDTDAEFINTTISGNEGTGAYGGVLIIATAPSFTATFINCTITDNVANGSTPVAGGLAVTSASPGYLTATLYNTIVAGNNGDVWGDFDSDSSHNLIGAINNSTGLTGNNTLYGTTSSPYDAGLEELGQYGGPTRTHRLLSTSDARDAGDDAFVMGIDFDQRGFDRIVDEAVDIGAVELAFEEF